MRQEPDVFISYSSKDEPAAETVCRVLEQKQIRCWIAPRDVPGGSSWDDAIVHGLESSCAIVLIFSSHANGSHQVKKELHLADSMKKVVIPLRIEDVNPEDQLRFLLAGIHWIDAMGTPLESRLGPLIARATEIKEAAAEEEKRVRSKAKPVVEVPRRTETGLRVALLYKRNAQPDDHVLSALEAGLRAAGHQVFIDRHLRIGVEWATEIERQVQESDAVIPILSAASVESEMLAGEMEVASQAALRRGGKPRILPVRVKFEDSLPEPFFGILGRLQYHLWRAPADDDELLAHMLDSLVAKEQPKLTKEQEPGGADLGPYYIERPTDAQFHEALNDQHSIVLVKGARQMGKTSLLARGLQQARKAGKTVALLDLQKLNQTNLADIESLYKGLGEMVADQLNLDVFLEDIWRPGGTASVNLERYIRREVLGKVEGHLILAFDEVDRLFEWPYASEVFGLFRSWHNARANYPDQPWPRLTLAIVYATEAHLFIKDQNQSPFNVGTQLELHDFGIEQVGELNRRYQSPLRTEDDLKRFYALFNGQPYLTRRGFYELTSRGMSLDDLVKNAASDDGPCGDHLRRMLLMLARNEDLNGVLRGLLRGEPIPDANSFYRLRSGGLVTGTSEKDAHFRCAIYEKFLARHLD